MKLHGKALTRVFACLLAALTLAGGIAAAYADETADKQAQYDAAVALFDAEDYQKAAEAFAALGDFSDSARRAETSLSKWKAATYKRAIALYEDEQYYEARELFASLESYQNSRSYRNKCHEYIKSIEYRQAKALLEQGDYEKAKELFESLGKFHDSRELAQEADEKIKARDLAIAEEKAYGEALALKASGDLESARDAFIQAGAYRGATDQLYEVVDLLAVQNAYKEAQKLYDSGDYSGAREWFAALGDYEDSADKAAACVKARQTALYERAAMQKADDPDGARILYLYLGDYKDSAAQAEELQAVATPAKTYAAADALEQADDFELAKLGFEAAQGYEDSAPRAAQAGEALRKEQDYARACCLQCMRQLEASHAIFATLGDYKRSEDLARTLSTKFSATQLRDDKETEKSAVFTAPDGSKHQYQIFKGVHLWLEARAFCEVLGGHLATLTTDEENQFVYWFMRDNDLLTAFFGLSDEKRVGDWIWVTGEAVEYINWHKGQPSYSPRERYGMYFYKHTDGTWNDSHFYEYAKVDPGCSYICEWDLEP